MKLILLRKEDMREEEIMYESATFSRFLFACRNQMNWSGMVWWIEMAINKATRVKSNFLGSKQINAAKRMKVFLVLIYGVDAYACQAREATAKNSIKVNNISCFCLNKAKSYGIFCCR